MQDLEQTRQPAVAGKFYPDNPSELKRYVDTLLSNCWQDAQPTKHRPRAMILPHAGYPFSGEAAAKGYALLRPYREQIKHVALLGPSHCVDFQGMAVPSLDSFSSPLGPVAINANMRSEALNHAGVITDDAPHAREHSLEVHLPFLQQVLLDFDLLPIAFGRTTPESGGQLIEALLNQDTLIIVSSDLSHFFNDDQARRLDRQTSTAIEKLDYPNRALHQACGAMPIHALLWAARNKGLQANTICLRNSGDVTGERSSVVGYGSYVFH